MHRGCLRCFCGGKGCLRSLFGGRGYLRCLLEEDDVSDVCLGAENSLDVITGCRSDISGLRKGADMKLSFRMSFTRIERE